MNGVNAYIRRWRQSEGFVVYTNKWTFALVVILVGVTAVGHHLLSLSEDSSHMLGLTYRAVNVPCESRAGLCSKPDPRGVVVEFIFPPGLWADDRKDRYDVSAHLNLFIEDGVISDIPQGTPFKELRARNYLRGYHRTVEIYAWKEDESFEGFLHERGLRWASPGGFRYREYKDFRKNYLIFDAEQCVALAPERLDVSESDLKPSHPCHVSKRVRVPLDYEWAFASCIREYKSRPGHAKLSGCTIHSRIAPGLYMQYTIDGEHVNSHHWVGVDKKIREYILSLGVQK